MEKFEFNNLIQDAFRKVRNAHNIEDCDYADFYGAVKGLVISAKKSIDNGELEYFDEYFNELYENSIRKECFEE